MAYAFPVVDLFAGPGGLGEGFSAFCDSRGQHPFAIALSVEKEPSAFETLRLRSFLRQFGQKFPKEYYEFINGETPPPDWRHLYPKEWDAACHEVLRLELGTPTAKAELRPRLTDLRKAAAARSILIGGPPCQAYSLVGRARNRGIKGYKARNDLRHFLYREYIEVIHQLQPAVFVMENVKGMISSSVDGKEIFDLVLSDLRDAGGRKNSYRLFALTSTAGGRMKLAVPDHHRSFAVRAEEFGIPQARHRVIVIGVRADIEVQDAIDLTADTHTSGSRPDPQVARSVLAGLPRLRSGLSKNDSSDRWVSELSSSLSKIVELSASNRQLRDIADHARKIQAEFRNTGSTLDRISTERPSIGSTAAPGLRKWILDSRIRTAPNSETRTHMPSDLTRYLFSAIFGAVRGRSPKASDFPAELSPSHRNWKTGKFSDRFRVQLDDRPSSTITSHIAKDGHYFIHPDPLQCRSLTVREAARLQTFPDNYYFTGNRTQQYVQVGNAVPPYLALQIAEVVANVVKKVR